MFSHNAVSVPESKTTRTFHSVCQTAALETKFAFFDCILLSFERFKIPVAEMTFKLIGPESLVMALFDILHVIPIIFHLPAFTVFGI